MRRLWRPWTVLIQRESTYRLIFRVLSSSPKEFALSEKERGREAFGIGVSEEFTIHINASFFLQNLGVVRAC